MSLKQLQNLTLLFLPGIVCLPFWAYLMTIKGVWGEAFSNYYPMSLAMIAGCLIAGSTPLGGAVVAFPVAVLVLKFEPAQGRDFAVLIQSVGMTAAAYLIAIKKPRMVNTSLVKVSCVSNTFGVILGFLIALDGFWVNATYMTYTALFALVLFYEHCYDGVDRGPACEPVKPEGNDSIIYSWRTIFATICLFLSGIVGGILASKLGSGSDTVAYTFGIFVYNPLFANKGKAISESSLTVSSVVIMAYTTVVVTIVRLVQGDISRDVFLCWGAVLWIVVFGAPIGSLLITAPRERFFRRLFYALAVAQFIVFATLKIRGNIAAWIIISSILFASLVAIALHAACVGPFSKFARGKGRSNAEASVSAPAPECNSVSGDPCLDNDARGAQKSSAEESGATDNTDALHGQP